ncbi:MAG: hypothetical protein Q9166_001123 [cf. Caloplaca sp. 2 TL-2023]
MDRRYSGNVNVRNRDGQTALYRAAGALRRHGSADATGEGADVNITTIYGSDPLAFAATYGSESGLKLLLEHPSTQVDGPYHFGEQGLICAARQKRVGGVKLLLQYGASTDITGEEKRTALCVTAFKGDSVHVQMLLKAKADVNHHDNIGGTPLTLAFCGLNVKGYEAVVKLLLDNGADPEIITSQRVVGGSERYKHWARNLKLFAMMLEVYKLSRITPFAFRSLPPVSSSSAPAPSSASSPSQFIFDFSLGKGVNPEREAEQSQEEKEIINFSDEPISNYAESPDSALSDNMSHARAGCREIHRTYKSTKSPVTTLSPSSTNIIPSNTRFNTPESANSTRPLPRSGKRAQQQAFLQGIPV